MTTRVLFMTVMLLTLTTGEAIAQSSSDARVVQLEEAVRVLEQRVAALEDQLRTAAAKPTGISPTLANWRKLRKGMSQGDVEQLLGSPSRVSDFGPYAIWHYSSGGEVTFRRSGTVDGWNEPYTRE